MIEEQTAGVQDEARFAAAMKRIRESRGISQGGLAGRLNDAGWEGFRQATVSRIEKGERTIRLAEAHAIAQTLGLTLERMMDEAAHDDSAAYAQRISEINGLIHDLTEQIAANRQKLNRLERMLAFYQDERAHLTEAYAGESSADAASSSALLGTMLGAVTEQDQWMEARPDGVNHETR